MNTRRELLLGLGALGVAALGWHVGARGGDRRIPNTRLQTHEGRTVRFYDDLVRDKLVVINMMYAACTGICPTATANLRQVYRLLGARAGREVFLYSLSLQPQLDSPQVLGEYARQQRIGPGWLFLTGAPEEMEQLRYSLGFYDPDPALDADKNSHTGMLRIGNERYRRWTMAPALATPRQIMGTIEHVDI
ncbi:SCO family protein [Pseudomonas sp. LPB0260]|uniref:SCO family protein n=1 Tax=Pseudomonas sp. LPB0260 TaxID=2614442 RepID=UPI0015C1CE11|nr:SCO family protein [Pseudomonas sp. LPB0260]QLC72695.1 SCO family protein [Pseudomonas sp. LPB0260]QLC75469.1 SCO family protein [Pseudomonas sp. LPB0260]